MKLGTNGIRRALPAWALAAAAAVVMTGFAAPADAGGERRYMFSLAEIKAGSEVPSAASREIRDRLASSVEAHERLLGELPASAPDPVKEPEKFERFMRAQNLRAFKVHVEVISYRAEVKEQPDPDPGHLITVHLGLRMFGEGLPKATLDFSGDGSATVQVPAGRRVRARDRGHAHETAIRIAVEEAIQTSIRELDGPKKR